MLQTVKTVSCLDKQQFQMKLQSTRLYSGKKVTLLLQEYYGRYVAVKKKLTALHYGQNQNLEPLSDRMNPFQ